MSSRAFALLLVLVACKSEDSSSKPSASSSKSAAASTSKSKSSSWYDGEPPVGVWTGVGEFLKITGPYDSAKELRLQSFVAWPDGHLSLAIPWSGLADFDRAAWERDVASNASLGGLPGTYKPAGDGWHVTYNSGHEAELTFTDKHLKIEHAKMSRATDVTGATLDGLYTHWTDPEHPLLAGPGCQPLVRFTPDGHFEDRGGFAVPCVAPPAPDAPGVGTYEIRDFSLVLHYSDGRTVKHLITAPVDGDLRRDSSRAIIMGRVWQRRTSPIAEGAPVTQAPAQPPAQPTTPVATSTGDTTTYDVVAFATPPGQAKRNNTSISFTETTGDQLVCMTAVFASVPSAGDPARDFAADWKDIVLNGRTADATPSPQQGRSPHGLVFTAGGSMTTESSGTRVYRALVVVEVGNRRTSVMIVAPSEDQLARCHLDTLLETITAR